MKIVSIVKKMSENLSTVFIFKTCIYGKCAKISYTKVSDKIAYANSVDSDQTAPEGAV